MCQFEKRSNYILRPLRFHLNFEGLLRIKSQFLFESFKVVLLPRNERKSFKFDKRFKLEHLNFIYLFIYLFIYSSQLYLFIYSSQLYLFIYSSQLYLFIYLFIHLNFIYLFICLFIYSSQLYDHFTIYL